MRSSGNRPPEHSHSSSLTPSRHTRLSDLMALRKSMCLKPGQYTSAKYSSE